MNKNGKNILLAVKLFNERNIQPTCKQIATVLNDELVAHDVNFWTISSKTVSATLTRMRYKGLVKSYRRKSGYVTVRKRTYPVYTMYWKIVDLGHIALEEWYNQRNNK